MSLVGVLAKNEIKRWEIQYEQQSPDVLHSSSLVEVRVGPYWIKTRVEFDGVDYGPMVRGIKFYEGQEARLP